MKDNQWLSLHQTVDAKKGKIFSPDLLIALWRYGTVRPVPYQFASFSFHIYQTNNSWDTAVAKFDLETSKVKVMTEVKGEGHILYPVSDWCNSFLFHINQTNHF